MIAARILCAAFAAALLATARAQTPDAPQAPASGAQARGSSGRIYARSPHCRPRYPEAALRTRAQGTTVLRFTLDASATVMAVDVVKSAGPTPEHALLDQAAAQALATCPFEAGRDAAGQPVGTQLELSYVWKIE